MLVRRFHERYSVEVRVAAQNANVGESLRADELRVTLMPSEQRQVRRQLAHRRLVPVVGVRMSHDDNVHGEDFVRGRPKLDSGFRMSLLTVPSNPGYASFLAQTGIDQKSRVSVIDAKCCVPNLLYSHCHPSCVYSCTFKCVRR
jgi:hypothetical protein